MSWTDDLGVTDSHTFFDWGRLRPPPHFKVFCCAQFQSQYPAPRPLLMKPRIGRAIGVGLFMGLAIGGLDAGPLGR